MDLNNIELPAFVVADLYQSSLIETGEIPLKTQPATATIEKEQLISVWKSVGGNQKNILIIVNYTDVVHLPDSDLTFLTGILGACKLSLADVAIVNLNNHPEASYKELTSFFKSKIVFLFAVEPASFGLPMSFPHFQIQAFASNSFLFSPSLKELENDKLLKSKLWVCLKRLFNL
jgi:hypothetical protein